MEEEIKELLERLNDRKDKMLSSYTRAIHDPVEEIERVIGWVEEILENSDE